MTEQQAEPYLRKVFPADISLDGRTVHAHAAAFLYANRVAVYVEVVGDVRLVAGYAVEGLWTMASTTSHEAITPAGLLVVREAAGCKCGMLRHFIPGPLPVRVGT